MIVWQADLSHLPPPSPGSETERLLLVCDPSGSPFWENRCPRASAGVDWLVEQLRSVGTTPALVRVFRPQCADLFLQAGARLGWRVELTRHVRGLKRLLRERGVSIVLDRPPPLPLPEALLGREWSFARIPAAEVVEYWQDYPLPVRSLPEEFHPHTVGLDPTTPIPGIVIDGGRRAMPLARWLEERSPVSIASPSVRAGLSGGLVLESGLVERWLLATYEDEGIAAAALTYEEGLKRAAGLHFLLIRPDDSGRAHTGFWLLRQEEET